MSKNRYSSRSVNRAGLVQSALQYSTTRIQDFQSVVEFGCSAGKTLEAFASNKNVRCVGYDIAPTGDSKDNLQFREMDLNQPIGSEIFDEFGRSLFLALDVIEHLNDPFKVVREFSMHSHSGSMFVLSCPNFSSVRLLLAWINGVMPKKEFGFFDATHLHWLTPKNFHGLDVLERQLYIYSGRPLLRSIQKIWPSRLCSQFVIVLRK